MEETKVCTKCGEAKHLSAYHRRSDTVSGVYSVCKACKNAGRREPSPEAVLRRKQARKRNKRYRRVKEKYGLSRAAYDALRLVSQGVCAICGEDITALGSACVDHDHKTGAVRGLLCHHCNKGLGFFKDDPARLSSAIVYLQTPPGGSER
jgi:hypothetical protein